MRRHHGHMSSHVISKLPKWERAEFTFKFTTVRLSTTYGILYVLNDPQPYRVRDRLEKESRMKKYRIIIIKRKEEEMVSNILCISLVLMAVRMDSTIESVFLLCPRATSPEDISSNTTSYAMHMRPCLQHVGRLITRTRARTSEDSCKMHRLGVEWTSRD